MHTECTGPFGMNGKGGYKTIIENIAKDICYANCCNDGKIPGSGTSAWTSDHGNCFCGNGGKTGVTQNKQPCTCFTECSAIGCKNKPSPPSPPSPKPSPINYKICTKNSCSKDQYCDFSMSSPACKVNKNCSKENTVCHSTSSCCKGLACHSNLCTHPQYNPKKSKIVMILGILGIILFISLVIFLIVKYFHK